MADQPSREEQIFTAALQLATQEERAAYLKGACGGDAALQQRVEALLQAHERAGLSFASDVTAKSPPSLHVPLVEPITEKPGDCIDRYKLLQEIGEGGCGVVYMAEQEEPVRRRVALKVIKLGMDTKQVIARFEAERQALALMDHPNIAKVLDAGATETGRPFFVMELVKGIRITDYCDQNNLSTRARLELFIQVCQAIQHAHQKGIIHRDIKPPNILVTLHDGVPVPKVIDFGIAKATSGQRLTDKTLFTAFEQFVGTPAYMSPEQAEMSGLDIDTRSDIYALGVLLYELLTGRTPFDAKRLVKAGLDEIRRIIREEEPPRPSTRISTLDVSEQTAVARCRGSEPPKLIHTVRGDLDWIVMKAMEKDRTRRYETANGLAMDITRFLDNEPIVARPPSSLYRFQKLVRRNKLAFAAAAAVAAVLIFGAVVSTWQAVRATQAQRAADRERERAETESQRAQAEAKRAEESQKTAEHETILARRAAAQADARYLIQERLLPAALVRATDAFQLGGEWEDGLLVHEIAAAARRNWVLSARVSLNEPVSLACVTKAQGRPCLVVSIAGGLRVLDARTGAVLGSAPFDGLVRYLLPDPESNRVVAVSDSAVSVLSLPTLSVTTNTVLQNPISYATAKGSSLLLVLRGGGVCLLDMRTLTELSSFNWGKNPASKDLPFPRHACISPDGNIVLLHGGAWTHPVLVWDRRHDPHTFTAQHMHVTDFQFIDNTHFVTWFVLAKETDVFSEIHLYDAEQTPVEVSSQSVPNDDTKGHLQFQAWSSKEWGSRVTSPVLGLIGPSGLVMTMTKMGVASDFTLRDRYINLLPTEADPPPDFLAADLASGVLALRRHNDLLIFQLGYSWNGFTQDYCATACRDGILYVNHDYTPTSVRLFFVPFDPRRRPARFSLQWPADSKWLPWAIAATPDASTVAVIAQETDSENDITSRYGRVRALIYHPGDLRSASSAWPIENAFEVDAPPGINWSPRFVTLDPNARALLYWNSATAVTRYDPRDGKSLGSLDLGLVAARSYDGRRVAAVSSTGRLRVYDLASGDTLLDLAGKPTSALCFSADGSRLVAAQSNTLITCDIASGNVLSSVPSPLSPLAYPFRGNRFLAFQPDASGAGGSVVLADTVDARVTTILNRAGNPFTPAFFSDSGNQLAMVRNRWYSEVVRSLRPDELSAVLDAGVPETTEIQPLAATNLVTTAPIALGLTTANADSSILHADDIPALLSHLGDQVTIEGHVRIVSYTVAHNAANIELAGPDTRALLIWVARDTYAKLVAVLGQNFGAALNDRTVRATGRLGPYGGRRADWKDRLQLTLDDPSKLLLVAPSTQSN